MMAAGAAYEAYGYPWQIFFNRLGIVEIEEPPDPAPIGKSYRPTESKPEEPILPELPGDADSTPAETPPDDKAEEPKQLPGAQTQAPAIPSNMERLGYCKIPKLGVSENILVGSAGQLRYGVGYVTSTALPGQEGNCTLAGHRSNIRMHPFRHLDKLEEGDQIIVKDEDNKYTYQVYERFIVEPTEVWVLDPVKGETAILTLLTCEPVVNPTHRLIVRCRLVATEPLEKEDAQTS